MNRWKTLTAGMLLFGNLSHAAITEAGGLCDLPPPPAPGTAAFQEDLTVLHRYQLQRTPEECASAGLQRETSLRAWFGPATGVLTEDEVKRATPVANQVLALAGARSAICKIKFHRLRPYVQDQSLKPCIQAPRRTDRSYPSGHSAVATALSVVLARLFPAKAELILKQGYRVGENRILSGVHFPSDVQAGRQMSRKILQDLGFTNP